MEREGRGRGHEDTGTNDEELRTSSDGGGTGEELGRGVDGAETFAGGESEGSSDDLG
jgi:hypothetical protein